MVNQQGSPFYTEDAHAMQRSHKKIARDVYKRQGQSYAPYTGILKEEAGETISCVGQIGKEGMKETDKEILRIMLESV